MLIKAEFGGSSYLQCFSVPSGCFLPSKLITSKFGWWIGWFFFLVFDFFSWIFHCQSWCEFSLWNWWELRVISVIDSVIFRNRGSLESNWFRIKLVKSHCQKNEMEDNFGVSINRKCEPPETEETGPEMASPLRLPPPPSPVRQTLTN